MKTKVIFSGLLLGLGFCTSAQTFYGTGAGATSPSAPGCSGFGVNALYANNTNNNSAFGNGSLASTGIFGEESGSYNTAIGAYSLYANKIGKYNCAMGEQALVGNIDGDSNIGIGRRVMENNQHGDNNIVMGYATLVGINGAVGTCNGNVAIGHGVGQWLTEGSGNVLIGNLVASGLSGPLSNRLMIHNNGLAPLIDGRFDLRTLKFNVNQDANSNVEITAFGSRSGLKFTNLKNTNTAVANASAKVLSVDSNGNVILVNDAIGTGGFTTTCATAEYLPKSTGANSMACSQVYDNEKTVSIGFTVQPNFNYNTSTTPPVFSGGTVPTTGTVRLDVNGVIRTIGIFATSDKKFKKDIKPITSALETVTALSGKTYHWDKTSSKSINFDSNNHSGFIAQELEKVLPHLVATSDTGEKAVNYMELIPYLVEAIKEQQSQIEELKSQISDNFQKQNQDLIALDNTKIISVSPNPSNDVIAVSMNIEKSVANAKLMVYDLKGAILSSLNINERDNNITKTLQKDNFGKGVYIVSLVVNGKSIDSKKIIFN